MRIVITRIIQTSIVVDNGMDAGPIDNLSPEARQKRRSSSRVFAMIRMMVRGDDATMIDAIVMEAVVVVEVGRVVGMPTSQETQVRPVSLVVSPT